jgi:ABC-type cobalamin/Fe3+-siderophores transport system ATPase subunit
VDVLEALERVGVSECVGQRWEHLSDWERVMVEIAQGFVGSPRLLLVDDLFDGLGMREALQAGQLVHELARESGCGVLMGVSDGEAALCGDRVWSLDSGRVTLVSDLGGEKQNVIDFPNGEAVA